MLAKGIKSVAPKLYPAMGNNDPRQHGWTARSAGSSRGRFWGVLKVGGLLWQLVKRVEPLDIGCSHVRTRGHTTFDCEDSSLT